MTSELVEWADLILVMEKQHQRKLAEKFRSQLSGKRVACLGIADNYAFMEDALVELLHRKVEPYLVRAGATG